MVIFRIIRNLFRLGLGLAFSLLWLPLAIFRRHLFLLFIVGLGIYFYTQFTDKDSGPSKTLTPGAAMVKKDGKLVPLIEPVRKREDGNSKFATDLYALMNENERAYYSQVFYWAMNVLQDGQQQRWENGNSYGSFKLVKSFENKSGERCRTFSETLKVRTTEQAIDGTACENGAGSGKWCKLKLNATHACNLGGKHGFWDNTGRWFRETF